MESLFCAIGSETTVLSDEDIRSRLISFLEAVGPRDDVLVIPPDYTRFHSQSGKITRFVAEYYNVCCESDKSHPSEKKQKLLDSSAKDGESTTPEFKIMPALGTHAPMTTSQIRAMFGEELAEKQPTPFIVHDWRNDVETIGYAPPEMVSAATKGMVNQPWPAQLNKVVWSKRKSKNHRRPLVLSIGQVVPHEVMGMANFNKNLFVGVGGVEAINLSHFIGAVAGMENLMGRASNPLRSILNYASSEFLQNDLDLWYVLTVMGTERDTGNLVMRGLYIGNDIECYNQACGLSLKVNFNMLERSPTKFVVHLDEDEFHSTWLGNKAIYRTRMAIADGGEIIILAPGVRKFGEDDCVDKLIRTYGYCGTQKLLALMEENEELKENLSAVAHLIHGSSEGRFRVTYCPGHLTKEEVEAVGFAFCDLATMTTRYDTRVLQEGWNTEESEGGEKSDFYYISNPALGLWATESRFENTESINDNPSRATVATVSSKQTPPTGSGDVGGWAKSPPLSDP